MQKSYISNDHMKISMGTEIGFDRKKISILIQMSLKYVSIGHKKINIGVNNGLVVNRTQNIT